MTERTPLISGNWKMHHNHFEAIQVTQKLHYRLGEHDYSKVGVSIHPPFTDIRTVQTYFLAEKDPPPIAIGAQNCHWEEKGAFTGEVSPAMLAKLDVAYVIAGHSERRELFRGAGCAGLASGEGGGLVVAYEPSWAIGTGRTSTSEDAQAVCATIRATVAGLAGADAAASLRIQYGGSVKPDNAADLMACPDIDGALVGGASLEADSFAGIVRFRDRA